MRQCNTDIRVSLENWHTMPEWSVVNITDNLYATRVGFTLHEPRQSIQFENDHIQFAIYYSEGKHVSGYTLLTKTDFLYVQRDWYLSCINPTVVKHHSPTVLFKDIHISIRQFNTEKDASYWYIVRRRST